MFVPNIFFKQELFQYKDCIQVIPLFRTLLIWVQPYVSLCGICSEQSDIWTEFSPSTLVLPCQYLSTNGPHLCIIHLHKYYIILATDSIIK